MFEYAYWIVRFYYVFNLYFVYVQVNRLRVGGDSAVEMDLLWPVLWVRIIGPEIGSLIVIHLSIVAGLLGVFFYRYRPARILVVLAQLLVAAYLNSSGAINHGLHMWLWVGFCFVFLPNGTPALLKRIRAKRLEFMTAFSMAQGLVLLFYSLSGAYKMHEAIIAVTAGRVGGFSPQAMALTLASRSLDTGVSPVWAPVIIENPMLGWPLYLGLYYVEFVAVLILWRPELHKLWGLVLLLFHLGTLLFMGIPFPAHILLVTMLLVFSPFTPKELNRTRMFALLPGVAMLLKRSFEMNRKLAV